MAQTVNCPLCNDAAAAWTSARDSDVDIEGFDCPRCGRFKLCLETRINITSTPSDYWPVSTFSREITLKGEKTPIFVEKGDSLTSVPYAPYEIESIASSYWPRSVAEKIERALFNLGRMTKKLGEIIRVTYRDDALLYSRDFDEALFLLKSLEEDNLIEIVRDISSQTGTAREVRVRAGGWRRINDVMRTGAQVERRRVFVAMWFSSIMTSIYLEGLKPSIEVDCGFEARRIDFKEFNEDVISEIFTEIRSSRLLVADLTGQRNGVYFEAGYAKGLGLPVILCCRQDALADAHFDLNHLNIIVWKDVTELRTKLTNRIRATIDGANLPT